MAYIVKMPKLGLEMEEGTVLEWVVEPGEEVAEGDEICEVESEKSIGVVEAREDGVVRTVYAEEGDSVPPGTPIGVLATPDADIADLRTEAEAELAVETGDATTADAGESEPAEDGAASVTAAGVESGPAAEGTSEPGGVGDAAAEVKASPRAERRAEELGVDLAGVEGTGVEGAVTADDVEAAAGAEADAGDASTETEVKASPRARQRADELGVDLSAVEGTGFEGSVTEEDVEAAAEADTEPDVEARAAGEPATETPERTSARWITAADPAAERYDAVTEVADPAAADALVGTTEAARSAFEERVTTTDVLAVVAAAALADRPLLNATYAESTHQVRERRDVALVAGGDGEVATTVLRDVGGRSLSEVVDARLTDDDADGGAADDVTFTLANAAETDAEGRLVNPPAVAALEVDATGQRAVPDGEGVDLRRLVTAKLTYDTRAVGETEARAFLGTFLERAERASELVLGTYRGKENRGAE